MHDLDDGAGEVVLMLEDAVKELAALAELHDEVHVVVVLARTPRAGTPPCPRACFRHAPRDLHLALHVVVRVGPGAPKEQPLPSERLARQGLPR